MSGRAMMRPFLALASVVVIAGACGGPWETGGTPAAESRADAPLGGPYEGLSDDQIAAARHAVQEALEKNLSGESRDWQAADVRGRVTPLRTFKADTGAWCREFAEVVEAGTRDTVVRLACRTAVGRWLPATLRAEQSRSEAPDHLAAGTSGDG